MAIDIISIGSSSSGNSYIIRAGQAVILLDVGLTAKRILQALETFEIEPEDVSAVLITHEHTDHVKSIRAISRKCSSAVILASRGTMARTENFRYVPEERIYPVRAGEIITIPGCSPRQYSEEYYDDCNNIKITAFSLSHDAVEPLSYTIEYGGDKLAVVTDTGIVTEEIYDSIKDADILVLEANHDEDLLMFGEYPYPLKVRIKGDHGHLSNRYAGEVLARLLDERTSACRAGRKQASDTQADGIQADGTHGYDTSADVIDTEHVNNGIIAHARPLTLMLAHLSFHNNAPFYARSTIEEILKEKGYERGVHYTLSIASKDEITELA